MAKNNRKSIGSRLRFEVFKRDFFSCQYCGQHPPKVILQIDHVIAVSNGGLNDIDNLITSCGNCNVGKSNVPLTDIPKSLKEKAIEIGELELQIKGYSDIIQSKRNRIESEAWQVATILDANATNGFDKKMFFSIKKFLEILSFHEVIDAMEIAVNKTNGNRYAFKYFCGVCWNKIKEEN